MNKQTVKDYKKRQQYKFYEIKKVVLKSIIYNQYISLKYRLKAQNILDKFPRYSRLSLVRNRCILTGRGRGIYGKFKLSRIMLRNKIVIGEIAGFKKSSW